MRHLVTCAFFCIVAAASAQAQGVLGKDRPAASEVLEQMASVADGGVRSGSCLRRTGDAGSEEFAFYLLLPASRIEGFVIEFSGNKGGDGEVVANAGIVSFDEDGDATIRGNLGMDWIADAYRRAGNFIRSQDMYDDASYQAALDRIPIAKCPLP
jgi:hypothetical protein